MIGGKVRGIGKVKEGVREGGEVVKVTAGKGKGSTTNPWAQERIEELGIYPDVEGLSIERYSMRHYDDPSHKFTEKLLIHKEFDVELALEVERHHKAQERLLEAWKSGDITYTDYYLTMKRYGVRSYGFGAGGAKQRQLLLLKEKVKPEVREALEVIDLTGRDVEVKPGVGLVLRERGRGRLTPVLLPRYTPTAKERVTPQQRVGQQPESIVTQRDKEGQITRLAQRVEEALLPKQRLKTQQEASVRQKSVTGADVALISVGKQKVRPPGGRRIPIPRPKLGGGGSDRVLGFMPGKGRRYRVKDVWRYGIDARKLSAAIFGSPKKKRRRRKR